MGIGVLRIGTKQGWTTDYSNGNGTSISGFKFQHVSFFFPSVFSESSVVKITALAARKAVATI